MLKINVQYTYTISISKNLYKKQYCTYNTENIITFKLCEREDGSMKENTQFQISFSNLTINTCFNYHYVVPDYQREYVWDQAEVEQLLSDLTEAFSTNRHKDYFLGTIVTYKTDNHFELIDGQQRLTTFFILLCALRKIYNENKEPTTVIDNLIFSPVMNEDGDTVSSYRLQLQYEEASNYLELIYLLQDAPKQVSASGERLFGAFDSIVIFLSEKIPSFADLKKFASFLLHKTRFIQIETYDITDALKIFETINQRGVGLNPMDLLKNMIFRQVDRSKFKELNMKWKEITSALESINEKPLRFLRYFIMSNYDVSNLRDGIIREDQIYKWLSNNNKQCKYRERPFEFVQRMKANVDNYVAFLKPSDAENGNIHLVNIPLLAGRSYKLHLMLMLSASQMESTAQAEFKKIVESVVYYTVINRITTNLTERTFAGWCPVIRKIRTLDDLKVFVDRHIIPTVNSWKENNDHNFLRLGLNSMQQYRVKFIIAKITAYVDALRIGKTNIGDLSTYMDSGVEIEHIMPQTCPDKSKYGVNDEEFSLYINRLGNLTLLENSINKSIQNDDYSAKSIAYQQSKFYLTKSIPALVDQGGQTAITRTNKKLSAWSAWNRDAIESRQAMLYCLSEEIWGIQTGATSNEG